jgi:hypothetical protein
MKKGVTGGKRLNHESPTVTAKLRWRYHHIGIAARLGSDSAALPPPEHLLGAVDESHLLSMQLTLNAHGIPHTVHRGDTDGVSKWPRYIAVDAVDFARATALVRELQLTPSPLAPWNRSRFRLFAAAATLLMLGIVLLLLVGSHP